MSYNYKFQQKRSFFYLTSFENDENITLVTNKFTKKLIRRCQCEIENLSPTGFKKSKNYNDLYTLWIRFLYKGIIINHNKNRANLH